MTATELAGLVACSTGHLSNLESGLRAPSEMVLEALAEALGFTPRFFVMRATREITEADCNFRSRKSTPASLRASARARGTLLAEFIAAIEEQVDGIPEFSVPVVSGVASIEDAERAADRCRMHIGLGLDAPIDSVVGVLEHCGVIVTRLEGTTRKIDAFSWRKDRGVVVLSADKDSATRSRFDGAHELGHLVMHPDHTTEETIDERREREANAFAAAFILPRGAFTREYPRSGDWAALLAMKERWGASLAAILFRARQLGLLSPLHYQRAYKFISAQGWRRREPREPAIEEPSLIAQAAELVEVDPLLATLGWLPATYTTVTGLEHVPAPEPIVSGGGTVVDLARARAQRSAS